MKVNMKGTGGIWESGKRKKKRDSVFRKFAEDYIPADMPEEKYGRCRRIYRIITVCFFVELVIVSGLYEGEGYAAALAISLLAFTVYIGMLIRWHQKNK